MSEHHGLDLDAIQKALGDHSIFAPSGSYMWLFCSGSLIPNLLAEDDAGEDAAYGTVGHEVGEIWLNELAESEMGELGLEEWIDECCPTALIGTTKTIKERRESFDILIDSEMVAYVRQYVKWCVTLPGTQFVETKVYFSELTPLPNQGGTADHAACEPGVLTITDLKMGRSPDNIVFAAEDANDPRALVDGKFNGNPQAMLYAIGFFLKFDARFHFERIVIRIAQPRLSHFDVWETTREELLAFAEYVKVRAALAWQPDAPRAASPKGCRWCKVKATCVAKVALAHDLTEGVFDAVEEATVMRDDNGVIEGEFRVLTTADMESTKKLLDDRGFALTPPSASTMTTAQMAKVLTYRKVMEAWFKDVAAELLYRGNKNGDDVTPWKVVDGRDGDRKWVDPTTVAEELEFLGVPEDEIEITEVISPAKAEEKLKAAGLTKSRAASLLAPLVNRAPGRPTLVLLKDTREELEDVGSVFEPVSDDDL